MNRLSKLLLRLPTKTRRIVRTCLYGLIAGLVAVGFHLCIQTLYFQGIRLASNFPDIFLISSFLIVLGTSIVSGYLLTHYCPEAAGSGIPQLKVAFWKDFGDIPLKVVVVKFFAGILSIGGGSSLGREGPSVQLAAGLSSNLAKFLGEPKQNRREAAAAGAAAGLAAAFNTPIAAVTFVLEEIIQDLNSNYLGSVLLASIVGAFTVYATLGEHSAFALPNLPSPSWVAYLTLPLAAAIAAMVGLIFQKTTMKLRLRRKRFTWLPSFLHPSVGAMLTWCLGVVVFTYSGHLGVFGLGYEDLTQALNHQIVLKIAVLLVFTKGLATILCYGLGGCGGIFTPSLFLGGMSGLAVAGILQVLGVPISNNESLILAVVGMSACLGAVVKAPMTSILIVFEMTHQFTIVPALMLGTLVSQAIGLALVKHNFYEEALLQDGHDLEHLIPPRDLQSWQRLPVSAIANFKPVCLPDLTLETVQTYMDHFPYQAFPVKEGTKFIGILSRKEALESLESETLPALHPLVWSSATATIRELQLDLIESQTGLVLIGDPETHHLLGIITLHDVLRNQVAVANG